MVWSRKRLADLSDDDRLAWGKLVASSETYSSPFFRAELADACADVFPDIEIGLHHDHKELTGVFAYRRDGTMALPVAGALTDFEGVIAAKNTSHSLKQMLASLELSRWDFTHARSVPWISDCDQWTTSPSPYVDLSDGFAAYRDSLFTRHSSIGKHFRKKLRQLDKAHGAAHVSFEDSCERALDVLLEWKSDQYEATGRPHPFHEAWARSLMQRLLKESSVHFRAFLVVLRVEEQPIAMEYIIASNNVAHALVTSYDPSFAKWSPGTALQLMALELLETRGFKTYDFGKGNESYKQKFMNGHSFVCEGTVDRVAFRQFARSSFHRARYRFLNSRFSNPARTAARRIASSFPAVRTILRMR